MPRKSSKKKKKIVLEKGGVVTQRKVWDTERFDLKELPKASISSGTTVKRNEMTGRYGKGKKISKRMLFHFKYESKTGEKIPPKKKPISLREEFEKLAHQKMKEQKIGRAHAEKIIRDQYDIRFE